MKEKNDEFIIINKRTGEEVGAYTPPQKKITKKPHNFYLEYYKNIILAGVEVSAGMKIIIGEMDRLNNTVTLSAELKGNLCRYYKTTDSAIRTNLTRMIERNIAVRLAPSVYFINPYYYTKANEFKVGEFRNNYGAIVSTRKAQKELVSRPAPIIEPVKIVRNKTND
jgi:hypothetical protein